MSEKVEKWPGIELSSKQLKEGEVITNRWKPRARYAWSCGEAISRFLEEMKKGKLIARKCDSCNRILFPPRMFCEDCFKPTTEWVYVKDSGKIETFSISYLDKDARRIKDPIFVGVVSIDGASEKMGIMHYFDEVTKEEIHIGMPVKAVWKSEEERVGSITDIIYFRPLKEGEE
ncbi:MAG: Zn-ribbon domain-containing OB-fold protein [Thermoplasmata archaeon]